MNIRLEINKRYLESDLIEVGMRKLNNHGMDYSVFEKDSMVYFFESVNENFLSLFCMTSRKSFYLS